MLQSRHAISCLVVALLILSARTPGWATLAGLIQVSTPDIQPVGQLSTTYQAQHPTIGTAHQLQFEVGLTPSFAIAIYQGLSPAQTMTNVELNLYRRNSFYISAGYLGTDDADIYQPFIEAGFHTERDDLVVGIQRQHGTNSAIMGFGRRIAPSVTVQADYISGTSVSSLLAAGLVFDIGAHVSVNPAIFLRNSDHRAFGFFSITWEAQVW